MHSQRGRWERENIYLSSRSQAPAWECITFSHSLPDVMHSQRGRWERGKISIFFMEYALNV